MVVGYFRPMRRLGEDAGDEARVEGVSRFVRDDQSFERAAQQGQIADEIERFVAAEFVGEAQFTLHQSVGREDDGVFERAAANQSHGAKFFDFMRESKSSRRGEFAAKGFTADGDFGFLLADELMGKIDKAADAKFVGRINADAAASFGDFERLDNFQIFAALAQAANAGPFEHAHEWLGRAVEDGKFQGVNFDVDVIDSAGVEGREQVFCSGEKHAVFHKAGGIADAGNVAAVGFDFEIVEIGAAENNAGAGRGRKQTEVRGHGSVEADAADFNGPIYGLLEFQDGLLRSILNAAARKY